VRFRFGALDREARWPIDPELDRTLPQLGLFRLAAAFCVQDNPRGAVHRPAHRLRRGSAA